nr:uncharacterized protein LOC122321006 [Drosophila bipectinata]
MASPALHHSTTVSGTIPVTVTLTVPSAVPVTSCNAIVQPLLGLLDKCQTKHLNFSELKDNLSEVQNRLTEVNLKYSELLEKHLESQDKCTDVALKYAEVQEKFQQTHQELRKSQERLQETTLKYDQVQYRSSLSRKFNRTYEEFINGFGDLLDEMFIGLEKLHILTNWKPHEVYLYHFSRDLRCDTFVVGDNSEGYSLKKLEGCTGDIPHYNLIQGTKFSTCDRDEDGNPDKNWARELRFGWWFSSEETDFQKETASLYFFIRRKD